jgi:hypothetical protein
MIAQSGFVIGVSELAADRANKRIYSQFVEAAITAFASDDAPSVSYRSLRLILFPFRASKFEFFSEIYQREI